MKHILKCKECGKFLLNEKCDCGGKAVSPMPPKYSPEDKYGSYRRRAKEEELKEKGLL
jgi:H/ACA ribonucleoprotein complex subunit 3